VDVLGFPSDAKLDSRSRDKLQAWTESSAETRITAIYCDRVGTFPERASFPRRGEINQLKMYVLLDSLRQSSPRTVKNAGLKFYTYVTA
jgi:hypothetical protein